MKKIIRNGLLGLTVICLAPAAGSATTITFGLGIIGAGPACTNCVTNTTNGTLSSLGSGLTVSTSGNGLNNFTTILTFNSATNQLIFNGTGTVDSTNWSGTYLTLTLAAAPTITVANGLDTVNLLTASTTMTNIAWGTGFLSDLGFTGATTLVVPTGAGLNVDGASPTTQTTPYSITNVNGSNSLLLSPASAPEPSTFALLGLGFIAATALSTRRKYLRC